MGDDPVLGHVGFSPDYKSGSSPLPDFSRYTTTPGIPLKADAERDAQTIVQAMGKVREWWTSVPQKAYREAAFKLLMKGFTVIEVTGILQELRSTAHSECSS